MRRLVVAVTIVSVQLRCGFTQMLAQTLLQLWRTLRRDAHSTRWRGAGGINAARCGKAAAARSFVVLYARCKREREGEWVWCVARNLRGNSIIDLTSEINWIYARLLLLLIHRATAKAANCPHDIMWRPQRNRRAERQTGSWYMSSILEAHHN